MGNVGAKKRLKAAGYPSRPSKTELSPFARRCLLMARDMRQDRQVEQTKARQEISRVHEKNRKRNEAEQYAMERIDRLHKRNAE